MQDDVDEEVDNMKEAPFFGAHPGLFARCLVFDGSGIVLLHCGACLCVCAPCSHRDSVELFPLSSAGGPGILLLTWSKKARQQDGILELVTPAYLRFFSIGMRLSPEPQRHGT